MSPECLERLRANEASIREHWDTLIRIEPISGPLANPAALALLIPDFLDRIFVSLGRRLPRHGADDIVPRLPACDCGNNPYHPVFVAAEQALEEAVILAQIEMPPEHRRPADLAETIAAVRNLGRMEIDTFCGACVLRGHAPKCRFHSAVQ